MMKTRRSETIESIRQQMGINLKSLVKGEQTSTQIIEQIKTNGHLMIPGSRTI